MNFLHPAEKMGESEVRQRKEEKSEEASKTEEKSSVCENSGEF